MTETHDGQHRVSGQDDEDDLEQILLRGITLTQETQSGVLPRIPFLEEDDDEEEAEFSTVGDLQGALGLYAEAAQDMATASVELGLGRHFACADFCNQATEKAAQSISLLRFGRRSSYTHDLRALGALIGAPEEILHEMDSLTPFHPEAFYADTPPEEADAIINAEQASSYIQSARKVMRWARTIVLA
jgi:HEPN domain-containing protein